MQALLQVLASAEEQLPPVSFTSILTTLFMSSESTITAVCWLPVHTVCPSVVC